MPILRPLARLSALTAISAGAAWKLYTRETKFVFFTPTSLDYPNKLLARYNPAANPPVCVDLAERRVPLARLQTTDPATLTRQFCRGVWSGPGYAFQRWYLERKYKLLPGRERMLWSTQDLASSEYPVGEHITDHFEVVERTPEKVVMRSGDSPLKTGLRDSDGLFGIEVVTEGDEAVFRISSVFFGSGPTGKDATPMPAHMQFLHREYAKLWMETSVRRLLK